MLNFSMRLAANKKTLEVFVYDNIGRNWFGEGITADRFAKDLKAAGKVELIQLRINSSGGDVSDGLAIYNTLRRHEARKEVDIDGVALSIASIIAMSGDEIRMAHNALFMIHDPWGMAMGNAEDLRKTAEVMDKAKQNLVNTYVAKTGLKPNAVSDMMSEETWFTATEAFDQGFIDKVTDAVEVSNSFDLSVFKRVPQGLMQARTKNQASTPVLDRYRTRMTEMEKKLRTSFPS